MSSSRRVVCVAALVLAACPSSSTEVQVHPEAVPIHGISRPLQSGKAVDTLAVLDAVADGDRVVVLIREGYGSTATFSRPVGCVGFCTPVAGTAGGALLDRLFVSDDRGATWRAVPLEALPDGMTYQGLHLVEGRAVLVTRTPSEFRYFEFDVERGARVPNPAWEAIATLRAPVARGRRLAAWGSFSFGFDSYFEGLAISLPDGATVRAGVANTLSALGPDHPLPLVGASDSHDGLTWWAPVTSAPTRPEDFCLATTTLTTSSQARPRLGGCAPRSLLPSMFTDPVVAPGGELGLLGSDQTEGAGPTRVWWWPITQPPDPSQAVLLPADVRLESREKAVHPSLGGGVILSRPLEDGRRQYLSWTGTGFEGVDLPALCRPPGCDEVVSATIPLGGDEWLVFYAADVTPRSRTQELRVFVRRVKAPWTPVALASRRPGLEEFAPGAAPAGPLERACTHLAACGGSMFRDCVNQWMTAAVCSNADAFVSASGAGGTSTCASLRALGPRPCPTQTCSSNENVCGADAVAASCAGRQGLPATLTPCAALGQTCRDGLCAASSPVENCRLGPFLWQRCVGGRFLSWCASTTARHALDCQALGFSGCVDVVERPGMPNVPARCQ